MTEHATIDVFGKHTLDCFVGEQLAKFDYTINELLHSVLFLQCISVRICVRRDQFFVSCVFFREWVSLVSL